MPNIPHLKILLDRFESEELPKIRNRVIELESGTSPLGTGSTELRRKFIQDSIELCKSNISFVEKMLTECRALVEAEGMKHKPSGPSQG